MANPLENRFDPQDISEAEYYLAAVPPSEIDPRVERLVNELIGRVADKWTMPVSYTHLTLPTIA